MFTIIEVGLEGSGGKGEGCLGIGDDSGIKKNVFQSEIFWAADSTVHRMNLEKTAVLFTSKNHSMSGPRHVSL